MPLQFGTLFNITAPKSTGGGGNTSLSGLRVLYGGDIDGDTLTIDTAKAAQDTGTSEAQHDNTLRAICSDFRLILKTLSQADAAKDFQPIVETAKTEATTGHNLEKIEWIKYSSHPEKSWFQQHRLFSQSEQNKTPLVIVKPKGSSQWGSLPLSLNPEVLANAMASTDSLQKSTQLFGKDAEFTVDDYLYVPGLVAPNGNDYRLSKQGQLYWGKDKTSFLASKEGQAIDWNDPPAGYLITGKRTP